MMYFFVVALMLSLLPACTEGGSKPEQQASTPVSQRPPRTIGVIPDDLKAQTYNDSGGNTVNYDHAAQLKQLFDLENEGKDLYLLIGRGNAEIPHKQPLDTNNGKRVWVYGQIDKSSLVHNDTPHLFMNFDKTKYLNTIPDDLFSAITFDWSVTKFFRHMPEAVKQFKRILKPGGKLFIDFFVGAYYLLTRQQFQNLCGTDHVIHHTASGLKYCLGTWDMGISYELVTAAASDADELEMKQKRTENITNHLAKVFGPNKCVRKTTGYPVFENKDEEYFECTK